MAVDRAEQRRLKEVQKRKLQRQKDKIARKSQRMKPKTVKKATKAETIAADLVKDSSSNFRFYLFGVIAVSLFIFAISGPPLTLNSITEAAYNNDKAKLAEKIDFPQLNESIKSQLMNQVDASLLEYQRDNPFVEFAKNLTANITSVAVDRLVNPSSISNIITQSDNDSEKPGLLHYYKDIKYSFESFNSVKAKIRSRENQTTTLVLERDGLSWKLIKIILPNDIGMEDFEKVINSQPEVAGALESLNAITKDSVQETIEDSLYTYWRDHSSYPSTEQGIEALIRAGYIQDSTAIDYVENYVCGPDGMSYKLTMK